MNREEYQRHLASREWALLREAVRERAGNRCERCFRNPMDAVHHLTYERVGNERPEDLMAICNPCHEFLSGKSNIDPLTDGVKVYLAGPITGRRWREKLLRGSVGDLDGNYGATNFLGIGDTWPIAPAALDGGFDFVGPWFVDTWGGHGGDLQAGSHGDDGVFLTNHGNLGDPNPYLRTEIARNCLKSLETANVVFAWIEDFETIPAGSLWELGWASGREKPTVIAVGPQVPDDIWLARYMADTSLSATSIEDAWIGFKKFWPLIFRSLHERD